MINTKVYCFFFMILFFFFTFLPLLYGYDHAKSNALYKEARKEKNLHQKSSLYKRAINENPINKKAFVGLADTCEKLGELDDAIFYYKKSINIDPNFYIAYFGMGDVYLSTGQYSQAIKSYDKGLVLHPYDNLALAGRTIAAQKLKSYKNINSGKIIKKDIIVDYLNDPFAGINKQSITREIRDIGVIKVIPRIGIPIYFDFNKSSLSSESRNQLDSIAKALQSQSLIDIPIIIEGHTDDIGDSEYNLNLSRKRSHAVKNFLNSTYGINKSRLIVKGFGETRPVDNSSTDQARILNRRVEFVRVLQ